MRYAAILLLAAWAFGEQGALSRSNARLESALKSNAGDVIARIEEVADHYRNSPAAERNRAAVLVGKVASTSDVAKRHAAFAALAKMRHKGSSKYLKRWLNPPARRAKPSHIEAIKAAGMIADKGSLKTMLRLSDHKDTKVAVAASAALGGFATLPVGARKSLAIQLAKRAEKLGASGATRGWGRGASQSTRESKDSDSDPNGRPTTGRNAAQRRSSLLRATQTALREITGEQIHSAAEWGGWWRRAKKDKNPFD
jgi:hypothetical protein